LLLAILADDFITRSPFYPRKEFFAIGMYDEEIRMREDWDINIRMIAAGKPFALLDEPLYLYTRTAGSITTGNLHKLFFYSEKVLRKHHKSLADGGNKEISSIMLVTCGCLLVATSTRPTTSVKRYIVCVRACGMTSVLIVCFTHSFTTLKSYSARRSKASSAPIGLEKGPSFRFQPLESRRGRLIFIPSSTSNSSVRF